LLRDKFTVTYSPLSGIPKISCIYNGKNPFNCELSKFTNIKKIHARQGFALIIQIISSTFAHNKSDINSWDFLIGLHKK